MDKYVPPMYRKLKPEVKKRLIRLEKESGLGTRIMGALDRINPIPIDRASYDMRLKFMSQQRVNKYVEKLRRERGMK